jgi:glycosyltransferase involved in cell wall biosynthesis
MESCVYQGFQSFEVGAILDNSTDLTVMILRNLSARFGCIVVVEQATWVGPSPAGRAGVLCAKGRLIMSLDADDSFTSRVFHMISLVFMQTRAQMIHFRPETVSERFQNRNRVLP